MPTGKGFSLSSDLNLRQALLNGYERHTYSSHGDVEPIAAKRRRLFSLPKLKIAVMINDTTATLASLAYSIPSLPNTRVVMGLIVGAGCNATAPMKICDLHESKTRNIREKYPDAKETLISTEWTLSTAAAPFDELFIRNQWDHELDQHCKRPGFQPLEYMVGGGYTGELVRIICYDYFHRILGVEHSKFPVKLIEPYSISTEFLSLIVASPIPDELLADKLSQKLPSPPESDWGWTPEYAHDFRVIASAVHDRAASLVAAAVVGLLDCINEVKLCKDVSKNSSESQKKSESSETHSTGSGSPGWNSGPEELAVAFSGGVIQHYPHYKENVQRYIDRLMIRAGPQAGGKSVFLREASDGGIIGTGVLAGTASGEIGEIKVTSGSPWPLLSPMRKEMAVKI
jgi:hexokinase